MPTSASAAHAHLKTLSAGDVVVYDRGYYSYEMLLAHVSRGQDAVFRLKQDANAETVTFLAGALNEVTIEVRPGKKALTRLRACYPDTVFRNLEALALTQADAVDETITRMVENIASVWQSERPGRSYPRISLKPKSKWSRKGKVARAR